MRSTLLATAILAVGSLSPAAAADGPPVSNPTAVLSDFNAETITPVLKSAGYKVKALKERSGDTVLQVEAKDKSIVYMRPRVCVPADDSKTRCIGLQTFAIFDGQATAQSVAAFNSRYPFASAGAERQGGFYLSRYDIADFGMPRGNLAVITGNFIHLAAIFEDTVTFSTSTVAAEGYADDLEARRLNASALGEISDRLMDDAAPRHRAGYEIDAGELLELGAGSAPPKKIAN